MLCALKAPFKAQSMVALSDEIMWKKVDWIPAFYSKELQQLIDACLVVDPNDREFVGGLFKYFSNQVEINLNEA